MPQTISTRRCRLAIALGVLVGSAVGRELALHRSG
jgi:hypothetical protein